MAAKATHAKPPMILRPHGRASRDYNIYDAMQVKDRVEFDKGTYCHHAVFYNDFLSIFTCSQHSLAHFSGVLSIYSVPFLMFNLCFTLFSFISPLSSHRPQEDKTKQDILQAS